MHLSKKSRRAATAAALTHLHTLPGLQIVGGEFAWISKLKSLQYILEITNLKVPSKLALAHPRLQMKIHSPEYYFIGAYVLFFEVFFTLISGIAGTILLFRSSRRP